MKILKYISTCIPIMLMSIAGLAQNNNLYVTDRSSVLIDVSAIISAGIFTERIVENTQWINYSLDISPSDPLSSISVSIASGSVPKGIELYIQAGSHVGSGRGKTGRPTGKIRIDNIPKVLINDIGNSYTGNGRNQGHQLTLSMVITDFALLQPGDYTLYILYTLKQ